MPPRETLWPLDAHTPGKHRVLEEYLKAWVPILGTTQSRILFVDGFAGPGLYAGGEEGSPLIALRSFLDHNARSRITAELYFLFIEKDRERAAHLERTIPARVTLPRNAHYQVITGSFDETLHGALAPIEEAQRHLAPAFVMIDPFGVSDTPMSMVRRILRNPRCEVYISFMWEHMNRFMGGPEFASHLDELFGTTEWRSALHWDDHLARKAFIFDLYKQQLRAAGAEYVLHFELYRGAQLVYAVFFGTKSLKGCCRMKQAMWKVAPFGDFAFRGSRGGQIGLELTATDLSPLRNQLREHFGSGWVAIEAVNTFMESDATDYHPGQLKQKTLAPMEREGLLEVQAAAGRRRGQFPAGTRIRFR
jgi:three-Cys-motif partner protein